METNVQNLNFNGFAPLPFRNFHQLLGCWPVVSINSIRIQRHPATNRIKSANSAERPLIKVNGKTEILIRGRTERPIGLNPIGWRALPHWQACEIDSAFISRRQFDDHPPTLWNVVNEVEFLQSRTLAYCWLSLTLQLPVSGELRKNPSGGYIFRQLLSTLQLTGYRCC